MILPNYVCVGGGRGSVSDLSMGTELQTVFLSTRTRHSGRDKAEHSERGSAGRAGSHRIVRRSRCGVRGPGPGQ